MERTQQLTDEVQEQAESRRQTLHTMIDLAGKISASQALLLSGLKDAKHVFGQLEPADDDSLGLHERRDALQVLLHCVSKNAQTLKRYSSKLYRSILMKFGRNIQKTLE